MDKKTLATPMLVVILLVLFILLCNPIAMVGVGERGVKVTLGMVSPTSYTEGIHLITPFISKIKTMDVKTQKTYIQTPVYTKDIQQAFHRIPFARNARRQRKLRHAKGARRADRDCRKGVRRRILFQKRLTDIFERRRAVL